MVGTSVEWHRGYAFGEQRCVGLQLDVEEGLLQGPPSELGVAYGVPVVVGQVVGPVVAPSVAPSGEEYPREALQETRVGRCSD